MNGSTEQLSRGAAFLSVLAGIYLIVAPWWVGFNSDTGSTTNSWILGIIVGVLGLVGLAGGQMAQTAGGVNVLAGIWLVISPFVIGFSGSGNAGVDTWILGIIAIVLGVATAMTPATQRDLETQSRRHHHLHA